MKQLVLKILHSIYSPITRNTASFVAYGLLIFIPEIFTVSANGRVDYIERHCFDNLLFAYGISYCFCLFEICLKHINETSSFVFKVICHLLLYFVSAFDVFLIINFGVQFSGFVFQLILDTDTTTTIGFVKTFILTSRFFLLILLYVFILIIEIVYGKYRKFRVICKNALYIFAILFLLYNVASALRYFTSDIFSNNNRSYNLSISKTMLFNLNMALLDYTQTQIGLAHCLHNNSNILIDSCSYQSKNIILIIGESYIKRHSQLYGYYLPTTPYLSEQDSDIVVFSDVITPVNRTSEAFQNFLSVTNDIDKEKWYDKPLFPAIFKAAGYNVSFFSNQFICLGEGKFTSGYCFNSFDLSPLLFDSRNNKMYEYDEDLFNEYLLREPEVLNDSLNLVIIHLWGQHTAFSDRYPPERSIITVNDIIRPDLDLGYKQQIADYDNAVLYNDSVVNSIFEHFNDTDAIVFYFADHGDEVNDCRIRIGRAVDLATAGADVIHCQVDIPFIVYMTPEYRANHPEIVSAINRSRCKPFTTDDLSQLLFDVAGIYSQYFRPERSIINDRYLIRHRFLPIYGVDYDEICK